MNIAGISEIKKQLQSLEEEEIRNICLRLAKYKKENKELLNYLLFEADNEQGYRSAVKSEMERLFKEVPRSNVYFVKKSLRKILRYANRQIKYSGITATELDLRIYFCTSMREAKIQVTQGTVLYNIYQQQFSKILSIIAKLPEDIQADYQHDTETLAL